MHCPKRKKNYSRRRTRRETAKRDRKRRTPKVGRRLAHHTPLLKIPVWCGCKYSPPRFQDGGSHAQPCSGASIGSRLLPVSLSYRHDDNKLPLTLTLTLTRRTRSIHRELASTDRWFLHSDPKRPVLRSCTTA